MWKSSLKCNSVSVSIVITELVYFLVGFEKFYPKSSKKTSDKGTKAVIPLGTTVYQGYNISDLCLYSYKVVGTNTLHQLN